MSTEVLEETVTLFERFDRDLRASRKRDVILFLAGAEAFHTISHIWLALSGMLPLSIPMFASGSFTEAWNVAAIACNAAITAGLLYWAHRLK